MQAHVGERQRLAAERLPQPLLRERGHADVEEEPRQELRRLSVALVVGLDLLQERDRLFALAGARRGLAALERHAGLLEQRRGLASVAELLVELRRLLVLAGLLVRGRRARAIARAQEHRA